MKILRNKTFSSAGEMITKCVKRNKIKNINNEELSDFLEGPIERQRRRRGRSMRRISAAKKQILGRNTEIKQTDQNIKRAQELALRNNFDNEEANIVEKKYKKLARSFSSPESNKFRNDYLLEKELLRDGNNSAYENLKKLKSGTLDKEVRDELLRKARKRVKGGNVLVSKGNKVQRMARLSIDHLKKLIIK